MMSQADGSMEITLLCDDEGTDAPSPKRPREDKKRGAYGYKSKFQAVLKKRWPCIVPMKDNPHMFHCTVCLKSQSCAHQGEREATRHIDSV